MNKLRVNVVLDISLAFVTAALIGTGLLTRFVLLSGRDQWDLYGVNRHPTVLGLERHGWIDVHFALGVALILLVLMHLATHAQMLSGMLRKAVPNRPARILVAVGAVALLIALVGLPLFARYAASAGPEIHQHRQWNEPDLETLIR